MRKKITEEVLDKARDFLKQHEEWGCVVLSYQLKNEKDIEISPTTIWRRLYPHKEKEKILFFEMKRPHSMWHGDVMAGKRLSDGTIVYQCSIEDDYSRAYAGCLSKHKDARVVIHALIDGILHWKAIPTCFHYDNGGEAKCGIVKAFLRNLSEVCNHHVKFIPTRVNNPKGNGKKERGHKDDRRDFWRKQKSDDIEVIKTKFVDYLNWRNTKKGHFALKGKPSITRLEENKKPTRNFTKGYLESLAKVKVGERLVRRGGGIYFHNVVIYIDKEIAGERVELWETLNGLEIRYQNRTLEIIHDYWGKIKKLNTTWTYTGIKVGRRTYSNNES